MSKSKSRVHWNFSQKDDRAFFWNGCEDHLKDSIDRSDFVKEIRCKITSKKLSERTMKYRDN